MNTKRTEKEVKEIKRAKRQYRRSKLREDFQDKRSELIQHLLSRKTPNMNIKLSLLR